ncbi:MAG: indole-3-glycerol-phosphate synthase TrpC [Deltaproteobacteria bacterium]|nr:MAG: indole-3-glycerol-phosphate synthase TrpC [Deltaproteobacteria bacterium]
MRKGERPQRIVNGKGRRPSLLSALTVGKPPRVIAEIKRRSPSCGPLNPDLDPRRQAGLYQQGGARAISILTNDNFGGSLRDLLEASKVTDLPLLRKDFLLDPLQLEESLAFGASAVLLIAGILAPDELLRMVQRSLELGLEPLVEVHTEEELKVALRTPARLIGINARDLRTFTVDLSIVEGLAPKVPRDRVLVAESGIKTHGDIRRLMHVGVENFLVGEALVKAEDPVKKLKELIHGEG